MRCASIALRIAASSSSRLAVESRSSASAPACAAAELAACDLERGAIAAASLPAASAASCAATVSASCLTSVPSSLSSAEIGAAAARAVSAALWPWPSSGREPAAELGHLAGQVGGAARQVGDLVAEVGAVAQPRRHGVVERHARSARQPPRWSIPAPLIPNARYSTAPHGAGDQHHADDDEYRADAQHDDWRPNRPHDSPNRAQCP